MANVVVTSCMQRTIQVCRSKCMKNQIKVPPSMDANLFFDVNCKGMCNDAKHSETPLESSKISMPEEPTTCCMSGCANCVWIQYAEEITKFYQDGGEKAKEVILSKVTDPTVRAFLMMELDNLTDK